MCLKYAAADGWIISHLDHLDNSYKYVREGDKILSLKFNELLFDINSQYLRGNQVVNDDEESASSGKTRKRKRSKHFSGEDMEQMNPIKEGLARILSSAKAEGLFPDEIVYDNNEAARMISQKFYSDTVTHNIENLHGCNKMNMAIISETQSEKYVFPEQCYFYCNDIKNIAEKMELNNQFDLILLDPPWWNKSIRRKKRKYSESSYKMMYNEDLIKIPIGKLLSTNGVVAVWCTNAPSHLRSISNDMFPAWGVKFQAKWYWVKVTRSGKPVCDFNPMPAKQPYELLILGAASSNNEIKIPDGKLLVSIPSAVHSHKPPITDC
ncbi:methyltransferase-like protein 4 isoform X2 [Cephus cinctus]|uniref:Methyltransferase-like protein 4 isoform X2 n=1 Tax=Cephus cinctus TaxID=211228 RepID=A0AAJ7REL5_CEPCN|nr:methyltransferase-like protein 4 isoform X2 [Cephus cinctus]